VTCVGEPSSGRETEDPDWYVPADRARPVTVVGGGVAGLETARVAATRGHTVRIVEQGAVLGGVASVAGPGGALVEWLVRECERYARSAGALYLVIIVVGLLGQVLVKDRLIVAGDAAATAANITASQTLWRITVAAEIGYLALGVILAWLLYLLLRPINRDLALLGVFFNLVSIAVEVVARSSLLATLVVLGRSQALAAFEPQQLHALAYVTLRIHEYGFGLSLIFFGFVCLIFGYLIRKSQFLPALIGTLMQIAGVCYLVNSFAVLIAPSLARALFPTILLPPFIGESALCLWLLLKGVDVPRWTEAVARR